MPTMRPQISVYTLENQESGVTNVSHELCILYGDELAEYGFDDPHPFGRKRLPAFWKEFQSRHLNERVAIESPEICSDEAIRSFHTPEYVAFVKEASISGPGYLDYGDHQPSRASLKRLPASWAPH
jgi:acetoin utilization deacetylase AcuC-like enzyme